jgi:CTP synthase
MTPCQHGELSVIEDAAETDLDLAHYESFIDETLTRRTNVTTGEIYQTILEKELRGDFLGGAVQLVGHVTNEIKSRIFSEDCCDASQVSGLRANRSSKVRQIQSDIGARNPVMVHVTQSAKGSPSSAMFLCTA